MIFEIRQTSHRIQFNINSIAAAITASFVIICMLKTFKKKIQKLDLNENTTI